jgi:hypothetical protein
VKECNEWRPTLPLVREIPKQKSCLRPKNAYRSANNSAERVPGALIEPIHKIVEAIFDHIVCGAVIEPKYNKLKMLEQKLFRPLLIKRIG